MNRDRRDPAHAQFMRRQHVAWELGVTRHTLARMIQKDASFPQFFSITPGIEVIARSDFDRWIKQKRLTSRVKHLAAPSIAEK